MLLQEQGVGTVYLQVKVINLATHHSSLVATMGWSHTGRTLTVAWPAGSLLAAGSYLLSVSAHDHHGRTLLRKSAEASLTVTAPVPPAPKPAPLVPTPTPALPGVPTPAQTVADGAVFPVAGAHNFGGSENVFGAPRNGYLHQGQDILTAEGTPVLAPLAGTILTTSYQAAGAGYYAVEQTGIGFDFMFAHCQERLAHGQHGPSGDAGAGAVQGWPDRRRDRPAPRLRDLGRRLAGAGRRADRPAPVPAGVGSRLSARRASHSSHGRPPGSRGSR